VRHLCKALATRLERLQEERAVADLQLPAVVCALHLRRRRVEVALAEEAPRSRGVDDGVDLDHALRSVHG